MNMLHVLDALYYCVRYIMNTHVFVCIITMHSFLEDNQVNRRGYVCAYIWIATEKDLDITCTFSVFWPTTPSVVSDLRNGKQEKSHSDKNLMNSYLDEHF